MSDTFLVAYATRGHSTAEIAEAIARTLGENSQAVEVRPVQDVRDLTPYAAVVIGSAIQAGELLPEAMAFLQTHQAELARKPFAAFIVCMTMSVRPAIMRGAAKKFLEPVRALVKPASEACFAGVVNLNNMMPPEERERFFMRWAMKLGMFSEGDHRDWQAIEDWARGLPACLGR